MGGQTDSQTYIKKPILTCRNLKAKETKSGIFAGNF